MGGSMAKEAKGSRMKWRRAKMLRGLGLMALEWHFALSLAWKKLQSPKSFLEVAAGHATTRRDCLKARRDVLDRLFPRVSIGFLKKEAQILKKFLGRMEKFS